MMDNDIPLTTKFEMEGFDSQFFFISLFSNIFFLGVYFAIQMYHFCFITFASDRFKERKNQYKEDLQKMPSDLLLPLVETSLDLAITAIAEIFVAGVMKRMK